MEKKPPVVVSSIIPVGSMDRTRGIKSKPAPEPPQGTKDEVALLLEDARGKLFNLREFVAGMTFAKKTAENTYLINSKGKFWKLVLDDSVPYNADSERRMEVVSGSLTFYLYPLNR